MGDQFSEAGVEQLAFHLKTGGDNPAKAAASEISRFAGIRYRRVTAKFNDDIG